MCETRNESYSKRVSVAVSADSHQPSLTQDTSEGCFHDISLSVSEPICRICHCSSEEEELIQPCRCSGSVGYTHESCIRKWIVGSTNCACELCIYKFKTETKRIADIRKLRFPRPSFKGWLHVLLFLAFFSIMVTSLTWIMWSQFSSSQAAQSERESKEITYAYAINGGFIIMALIGLYLDSFGQCRTYHRRWSLLNQELIIFPYDMNKDVDCNKTADSLLRPHENNVNTSPTLYVSEAFTASTPNMSANKNIEPRDTTSSFYKNDGFTHDIQKFEIPMDSEVASHRHQWPAMGASHVVPTSSTIEQPTLHQSISVPANLRNILVLKETYV